MPAGLLGPGFPRLPLTEALTESAVTKPKNHNPPLATAFVVALGLALPGNLST
jgi:hypothetical protein